LGASLLTVLALLGVLIVAPARAERNVYFTGTFESGQIRSSSSTVDGFWVHTLPNPQTGATSVHSPDSSFGPSSALDTRVVRTEVVGSETVSPRKGEYFLRTAIYFEKDYTELNGGELNKPRSKIYLSDEAHRIDHDVEGFVGFSIFTPRNFVHETGVRDHRGEAILFAMNSTASRTHLVLSQFVQSPATEAHWFVKYYVGAESTNEDVAESVVVDLGPVAADLGKWTDFVIRYRFNPFATMTNPAVAGIPNAKNQVYEANKGILQVWKAEGVVDANGDRRMALKIDKVNTPIGLVPHYSDRLIQYWRIYKYGWHNNPTTVAGPIWYGFDEIRQGLAIRDGTGYADVSPSGLGCEVGCPMSGAKPSAPEAIQVH
jgi:hypothetical protein